MKWLFYIYSTLEDTILDMCYCNPFQNTHPFSYAFNQESREFLRLKLASSFQKRALKLAKHILINFLEQRATKIFKNGKIYTMDANRAVGDSIAIKNNKILSVGKYEDVILYGSPQTQIIDLQGRTMLPGFIDPHVHMCFSMLDHWQDFGPFVNKDMNQIKEKLKQVIKKADPNHLLCAQLFDPRIMKGQFKVDRHSLDQISKQIGLFILEANGHVAHVNSAALKLLGITKDTPDPPHGRLMRDKKGELTGEIQESAVGLFKKKFSPISPDQYQTNFHNFLKKCASKGCTSLHDCGIGFIDPKADLSLLLSTFNQNPPVRYSGMLVSTQFKVWQQQKLQPNSSDHDLRINGVKCWVDGSTQAGSAFLRHDYLKSQWGKGHANYSKQVLHDAIKKAHDLGWQVGVHCNGDAGIDLALQVYEQVQKSSFKPELRHRIQHSTICHPQQLKKMKQLHVYPSFLIGHIYYYGHVFQQILGDERANLTDPLKTAFELGLKPTIHSDYNCQPVDPLRCIHNAVTRRIKATGQVLNPDQCVSPYQAIMAMTSNAAFQCHMEDIVGSLEEGKFADFVILEENPMTIDPQEIINIKIHSTWMDGEMTYKGSQQNLKIYHVESVDIDSGKIKMKEKTIQITAHSVNITTLTGSGTLNVERIETRSKSRQKTVVFKMSPRHSDKEHQKQVNLHDQKKEENKQHRYQKSPGKSAQQCQKTCHHQQQKIRKNTNDGHKLEESQKQCKQQKHQDKNQQCHNNK